MRDKEKIFVS